MIKKLIVAATFAGSMLIGVPVANASPLSCSFALGAALAQCGSDDIATTIGCENAAYFEYTRCMELEAEIKS